MKRLYLYIFFCLVIGTLMLFKGNIRQWFSENLNEPTAVDKAWRPPHPKSYDRKVILELHYFNTRRALELINDKTNELNKQNLGVKTLLISGSRKLPTNTYLRELAKQDWGIEEVRLHSTDTINIYAFLNLLKSNSELKRVLIWNNGWDRGKLRLIEKLLPEPSGLKIIQE